MNLYALGIYFIYFINTIKKNIYIFIYIYYIQKLCYICSYFDFYESLKTYKSCYSLSDNYFILPFYNVVFLKRSYLVLGSKVSSNFEN